MGLLSPLGNSVDEFWRGCLAGRSGIGWITVDDPHLYPVKVDGEVKGFEAGRYMEAGKAARMGRFSQFAVAAAKMAIDDAALELADLDLTRVGVVIGNGSGGYPETDQAARTIETKGPACLDPRFQGRSWANMAAAWIAIESGASGFNDTLTTACAAGTQAIGRGLDAIRLGRADVVLAGGTEAGLCELGMAAFTAMRALSTRTDDPTRASRPFELDRDGFVASEGAAILVLESLEHARERGAAILAELAGYGACSDAFHVVMPAPDGAGAQQAMRLALADADVDGSEVDYINAHGTSTPTNDAIETAAIKAVFGKRAYDIPVSSTKSMIGHALGAAGAIESVACINAIQASVLPPTINYDRPDPACDLDYVPNVPRKAPGLRIVLKNSFGFGGQNACLVFRAFES